jgi:Domain of unknown function (DUF5615)
MRLLADENFNNEILRGIWRRVPHADITHVQDTELMSEPDPIVLAWAAKHGYIVLTHDVSTMRADFYDRLNNELPVPGLFLVPKTHPIGEIIDSLEMILLASDESEWIGKAEFLPL